MQRKMENNWPLCAVSSVVEHHIDTVGVKGSNPLPRTISLCYSKTWTRPGSSVLLKAWCHLPSKSLYAIHWKPTPWTIKNSTRNGDPSSCSAAPGLASCRLAIQSMKPHRLPVIELSFILLLSQRLSSLHYAPVSYGGKSPCSFHQTGCGSVFSIGHASMTGRTSARLGRSELLEIITPPLYPTGKAWKKLSPQFFVPLCQWKRVIT